MGHFIWSIGPVTSNHSLDDVANCIYWTYKQYKMTLEKKTLISPLKHMQDKFEDLKCFQHSLYAQK